MQKPFQKGVFAAAVLAALVLPGCAGMSQTEKDTATGAGIGAAAGAVIGAMTGGHVAKGAAMAACLFAAEVRVPPSHRRAPPAPTNFRQEYRPLTV